MQDQLLRVLVADDQPLFRQGVMSLLANSSQEAHTAEAATGNETLLTLENFPADIVLLNIQLQNPDGPRTTELILEKFPLTKVMALSVGLEDHEILRILDAGASGCLLKTASREETLDGLLRLASGEVWFSPQISTRLLSGFLHSPLQKATLRASITPREKEILILICKEYTNPEIAERLNISRRTVDTHRNNLLQKLEVRNTVGLIKYAMHHGFLDITGS